MDTPWIDSIKADLESSIKPKNVANVNMPEAGRKNMDKKWGDIATVALIVVLIYAIFVSYKQKTEGINGQSSNINQEVPWQDTPKKETTEEQVAKLKEFSSKVLELTKWNTDKITLLAILQNNNSCVIKNNLPKTDLIFVNADWTINKMPTAINLDEEDKKFLENYVKK